MNTLKKNVELKSLTDSLAEPDMLKLIQLCETNQIKLPKIVICDPTEVPTTPDELNAIVTQKVTKIFQ